MTEGNLMTVREVAREYNRSEETVRRWIWSGKLKAQKLGNQLFVNRADLPAQQQQSLREASPAYETGHAIKKPDGSYGWVGPFPLRTIDGRRVREGEIWYDKEEVLASLKRARAFSKELADRGISIDVAEVLRRHREEH